MKALQAASLAAFFLSTTASAAIVDVVIPDVWTAVSHGNGLAPSVTYDDVVFSGDDWAPLYTLGSFYTYGTGGTVMAQYSPLVITLPAKTRFVSFYWGSAWGSETLWIINNISLSNGASFDIPIVGSFQGTTYADNYSATNFFTTTQTNAFDRITLSSNYNWSNQISRLSYETGGVPEPGSWALLVAGFGLTGAAMRRRHLKQPA